MRIRSSAARALRRRAGLAALVFIAVVLSASGAGAGTSRPLPVTPDVGISPVVLGESAGNVSKELGVSTQYPGTGYVTYLTDGAVLEIAYSGNRVDSRVTVVASQATTTTVYGHRLARGRKALMPALRRHGWRFLDCNMRTPAAAHSSRSGLTLIEWDPGPSVTIRRKPSFSNPCDWLHP